MKTLGIAIPTYKNHVSFLEKLLDTINQSTILPDQVSVSISNYDTFKLNKKYNFDLILNQTQKYQNVSQNRNIAASKLNTDIISLIDGDDLPYIQRNEFILKSFQNKECKALVHDYKNGRDFNILNVKYEIKDEDLLINYLDIWNDSCPFALPSNNIHIPYHNAHISMTKDIFNTFKYNEDEKYKYREDSLYTKTLVQNNINISLLKHKLSLYIK
jgi:hypothetical protein